MQHLFIAVAWCLMAACNFDHLQQPSSLSGHPVQLPPAAGIPARYAALKGSVNRRSGQYAALPLRQSLPEARRYLFATITDSFFYYWYGTPWDFNGTTEVPNTGKIACGYFVTTVLRDAGFPIGRIRMAQAPASTLIEGMCATPSIKRYSSLSDLEAYLNKLPDSSLLILGLDNHVGFVSRIGGRNYFTHASCVGAQAVEQELLPESIPIKDSRSFMIGNLLANDALIRKWLGNRE